MAIPGLWGSVLQFAVFQARSEGYLRLVGLGVINIGFILIIEARSSFNVPGHGAILSSVLARFVYVNGLVLMMILRDILPLSFGLVFIVLDSTLAAVTLVVWCLETEGASVKRFFHEICSPLVQCRGFTVSSSITTIFLLGFFQMNVFLIFTIRPDFVGNIFDLDSFAGQSHGFLASYFFILSIHGFIHITNACNINLSFSSASLFYRLVWNIPVLVILFAVDQIERNLFVFLVVFDFVCCVIILFFIIFEKISGTNIVGEAENMTLRN